MRRWLGSALVAASVLVLAACGGPLKYNVPSSRLAPGADAEIVANVNEDQNQSLVEFHAKNLPPPARVNPNGTCYVAWQRKSDKMPWARLGTVKFDEANRTADLTATVPEQSFDFEVSVEANESVQSPSADVVFSQRVAK
jgi:predicted small lipoprotein YifL